MTDDKVNRTELHEPEVWTHVAVDVAIVKALDRPHVLVEIETNAGI